MTLTKCAGARNAPKTPGRRLFSVRAYQIEALQEGHRAEVTPALGHLRTFGDVRTISALPRQRTRTAVAPMSATTFAKPEHFIFHCPNLYTRYRAEMGYSARNDEICDNITGMQRESHGNTDAQIAGRGS
jgi:hypothetical protein